MDFAKAAHLTAPTAVPPDAHFALPEPISTKENATQPALVALKVLPLRLVVFAGWILVFTTTAPIPIVVFPAPVHTCWLLPTPQLDINPVLSLVPQEQLRKVLGVYPVLQIV